MHPLSLPLNQQPVKHPQLNRAALPNTLRMPENPYIGISKGRWAGTQKRAGTRTTAQVVPTVLAPSHSGWAAAPENPVAAEEMAMCPWAPAAAVPTDTGQWASATEEPGTPASSQGGIHSAGPPPTTHSSGSHQPNSTADGRGTLMSAPALPLSSREWHSGDRSCRGSACHLCAPGGEARDTAAFRSTVGSTCDTVQTHSRGSSGIRNWKLTIAPLIGKQGRTCCIIGIKFKKIFKEKRWLLLQMCWQRNHQALWRTT